jgi:hypothetical protein
VLVLVDDKAVVLGGDVAAVMVVLVSVEGISVLVLVGARL